MMIAAMAVTWTFVQSPTYSTVSTTVSVIAILYLVALVIRRELYHEAPVRSDSFHFPSSYVLAVPLLVAFAAVMGLRLVGIVNGQRPVHPTSTGSHAAIRLLNPTAQAVASRPTFFLAKDGSVATILDVPSTTEREVPVPSLEKVSGLFDPRVGANATMSRRT